MATPLRPRPTTWELPALALAMAGGMFGEVAILHQGMSFLWLELALIVPLALVGLVVLSLRGRLARRGEAGAQRAALAPPETCWGSPRLDGELRAAMAEEAMVPERARIGHLVLASLVLGAGCGYFMGRLRMHTGSGGVHREAIAGCLVIFPVWVLALCASTRHVMTLVTGVVTLNLGCGMGWLVGTVDEMAGSRGHRMLQDLLGVLTISTLIEVLAGGVLIWLLSKRRRLLARRTRTRGCPEQEVRERLVPRRLPLWVSWVLALVFPGGMGVWYWWITHM